jgi:CDP-diacylglycerol--glycerol-3-phosphate 3-phosphatidyltransferase/cardiolipin synthase
MPPRDSVFSLANLLSLSRLPLAVAFVFALNAGAGWAPPLLVLLLAGASDALDGWFARRQAARQAGGAAVETPAGMGSWLDPFCDKVFVATVLGALWWRYRPPLGWLALILGRELAQLPLSLVYLAVPALRRWLRYDFRASLPGKAATILQFAAIVALIFHSRFSPVLALAAFAMGMIALTDYVSRAVRMGRQRLAEEKARELATGRRIP